MEGAIHGIALRTVIDPHPLGDHKGGDMDRAVQWIESNKLRNALSWKVAQCRETALFRKSLQALRCKSHV